MKVYHRRIGSCRETANRSNVHVVLWLARADSGNSRSPRLFFFSAQQEAWSFNLKKLTQDLQPQINQYNNCVTEILPELKLMDYASDSPPITRMLFNSLENREVTS